MKRGKGRDMAAEYAAVREILKPYVERAEAAEAEAKRLREVLEAGLDLTQSWSDVRTHDWRNEARAALRGGGE